MNGSKTMTETTKTFLESVGKGNIYVLSAEGHGFGFSGESAVEARELTKANFARLKRHRGPVVDPPAADSA